MKQTDLVRESVLDQRPYCGETIAPGNLLAFRGASPRVGNRNFNDAQSAFEKFGSNFRFEVKPIAFNPDPLNRLPPEELVAGLHVGDGGAVEEVGDPGQEQVTQSVQRGHVLALTGETGAIDHIGSTVQNGLKEMKEVGNLIRNYPVKPPTAMYDWAGEANLADGYFKLIVEDGWPKEYQPGLTNPNAGMKFPFAAQ